MLLIIERVFFSYVQLLQIYALFLQMDAVFLKSSFDVVNSFAVNLIVNQISS